MRGLSNVRICLASGKLQGRAEDFGTGAALTLVSFFFFKFFLAPHLNFLAPHLNFLAPHLIFYFDVALGQLRASARKFRCGAKEI